MRIWGARMQVAGSLGALCVLGGARSGRPSGGATSGVAR